jgi:hypothetical protein
MEAYAQGQGHVDLANQLGIPEYESLAIGGSANSRILRTTLKHSYQQEQPTFYVLGMTFLSRLEIPILENQNDFEGRWTNPQNQQFKSHWQHGWSDSETSQFVDIKLKTEIYSILDRIEDLMYRIVSTIHDLKNRGHGILIYQQADNLYQNYLPNSRLKLFNEFLEIIDGFQWRAVPWQLHQGVPPMYHSSGAHDVPKDIRHPKSGHHQILNEFITNYIKLNL